MKREMLFLSLLFPVCMLATACVSLSPLQGAIIRDNVEAARTAIDQGADVNEPTVNGDTPLILAVWAHDKEMVRLLLDSGADPNIKGRENSGDRTPRMIAEAAVDRKGLLDPLTPSHTEDYQAIVQMLKQAETDGPPREKLMFEKAVQMRRDGAVKPPFPEEARKFRVQAEVAVRSGEFKRAADAYRKALDIAPWWPEGYFNRAIVLAEIKSYPGAIREMERYLVLSPNAPDARAAQDKIYEWQGQVQH